YQGSHEAPDPESGRPMHDVTGAWPEDFYSHEGFRYYSDHGNHYDAEGHHKVAAMRNRPNARLEVYRAVPKHVKGAQINKGDWVTQTRAYAHEHGQSNLGGKGSYKILKKTVRAN